VALCTWKWRVNDATRLSTSRKLLAPALSQAFSQQKLVGKAQKKRFAVRRTLPLAVKNYSIQMVICKSY
jgi:hypothetical protein